MRVTVGLSPASAREARRQVEAYRDSFPARLLRICTALCSLGVEVAVREAPVDTGDLRSNIRVEAKDGHTVLVVADSEHAAFVEFGTGVVGQGTYAGNLPDGWEYDQRRTPSAHDPEDPTWWYYVDPVDGEVHRTQGQTGKGFMLAASVEMRQRLIEVVREAWDA